jgi:hypothetical protein
MQETLRTLEDIRRCIELSNMAGAFATGALFVVAIYVVWKVIRLKWRE